MRLRSGSPWKCGGLKTDAAQNGPRVLSAAIAPRGSRQARPHPDALKRGAEGRRVWLVNAGKGLAWGEWGWEEGLSSTDPAGLQPTGAVHPRPADTRVSVHSLRTCPSPRHHHSPIHFHCSLLPHPSCPIRSSTPPGPPPHCRPPAAAPGLGPFCGFPGPRPSLVTAGPPHRPEGRGARTTHSAAQPSRTPSRMGGAGL